MNRQFRVLPWVAFGIALLLSFAYLFIGLGLINDQFYWIYLCKDYKISPMSVGTLWLGHIWGSLFSYSLISFRILKWLIELLTLFFACRVSKLNCNYFTVFICALSILFIGYGWQNEYGATVLTNLFVVLTICAFSRYITKCTVGSLTSLAIVSGASAIVRFPNIMIIPIVSILIVSWGICRKDRLVAILEHSVLFIGIAFALWWGSMAALLGTLNPLAMLNASMTSVAQGSHSFSSLLNGYLWDFSSFWGLLASSFLFGMTIFVYRGALSKKWKSLVCVCSVLLFGLFFLKTVGFHKWVNMQLMQFLSAGILILLLVGIYGALSKKDSVRAILYFAILMLVFVPTMGSDTRYLKLFPLTIFFLPALWQSIVGVRKEDLFFLPTCSVLVLCTLLCFWGNPVASSEKPVPLWTCTQKIPDNSLGPIRISKDEATWVHSISHAVESYRGSKVAYGFASFFLNYVSKGDISIMSPIFGDQVMDDESFFAQQLPLLQEYKYILICTMTHSLFEQKLVDAGYILREKNGLFSVYSL